ncbi:MAG: hypothetical protein ACLQJR_18495, partial [Stellaceae bacterium]
AESRPSTSFGCCEDVDGRDKHGHDESRAGETNHSFAKIGTKIEPTARKIAAYSVAGRKAAPDLLEPSSKATPTVVASTSLGITAIAMCTAANPARQGRKQSCRC